MMPRTFSNHGFSRSLPVITLCVLLTSCATDAYQNEAGSPEVASASALDILDKSLIAHGGLNTWQSYGSLEYDVIKGDNEGHHIIDLKTRRTLQSGENYVLGFDGKNTWVSPDLDAFPGNPDFYVGLDFYFFGIPFVLADPGTNRELLGDVTFNGTTYEAVKISYNAGVGASPDDYYIAHFDKETHLLTYLLYTVTFNSQEPNENYYARAYEEWQEVGGLLLPKKMAAYSWDKETRMLGEMRREAVFNNVTLDTKQPEEAVFAKPDNAAFSTP